MSQNIIPITFYSQSIPRNERFAITIIENACTNCSWSFNASPNLILISSTKQATSPATSHLWVFESSIPGTYTLQFYYKKRCCGNPMIQKEEFTITII